MFQNVGRKRRIGMAAVFALVLCSVVFSLAEVLMPSADGKPTKKDKLVVYTSHADEGYVMVQPPKTKTKMKFTVETGGTKLQYDIDGTHQTDKDKDGKEVQHYEVIPLQLGRTNYTLTLWKQVEGKKYGKIGSVKVAADMEDELRCFLYPNQYVDYTAESPCVLKAIELCNGMTDQAQIFSTVKSFVLKNFQYDFIKSVTVAGSSGMLPDIEYCWKNKMGICQDLSAMTCAMLRSQGVPARLIIGQLGSGTAHAWVLAVVNGEDVFFDPTAELNASNKSETYTTLRWY